MHIAYFTVCFFALTIHRDLVSVKVSVAEREKLLKSKLRKKRKKTVFCIIKPRNFKKITKKIIDFFVNVQMFFFVIKKDLSLGKKPRDRLLLRII